jgi:hypothetical protein
MKALNQARLRASIFVDATLAIPSAQWPARRELEQRCRIPPRLKFASGSVDCEKRAVLGIVM